MSMTVRITPNESATPAGKLADVSLHFTAGPLAGLKLIGFSVWQLRNGRRSVVFPSRTYTVHGEHRSFALLRPDVDDVGQTRLRDNILQAYADWEALQQQEQK